MTSYTLEDKGTGKKTYKISVTPKSSVLYQVNTFYEYGIAWVNPWVNSKAPKHINIRQKLPDVQNLKKMFDKIIYWKKLNHLYLCLSIIHYIYSLQQDRHLNQV